MSHRAAPPLAALFLLCVFVLGYPLMAQGSLPQVVDVTSSTAGQIAADAPIARFVVVAPAGGGSVDVQISSIGPGFAPHFRVTDPTAAVVIDVANPSGQPTANGTIDFGAPGAYVIEVSGEQGSIGQFVLTLRAGTPPPVPVNLIPGQPVSGIVGSQTPKLIYRFAWAGLAGQTLTILSVSPDLGPAYTISDEATGDVIAMSDGTMAGSSQILSDASRVYRVEVKAGSSQGDTPFTLCLACGDTAGLTANATATELPSPTLPPAPTALPTATALPCTVVSSIAGAVNVRKGPSTNYGFVGALRQGESYPAIGQTNGWYKLNYKGVEGWVSTSGAHLEGDCGALTGGAAPVQNPPAAPTAAPANNGGAAPAQNATPSVTTGGRPDIAFKSKPGIGADISRNQSVVVIEVMNTSNIAAGPSTGSACVASVCQAFSINALGPAGNTLITVIVPFISDPVPVKVVLDSNNQVTETRESNNVFQGIVTPVVRGSDEPPAQANNPPAAAPVQVNNPPAAAQAQVNNPPAAAQVQVNNPPAAAQVQVNNPPAAAQAQVNNPPAAAQAQVNNPPAAAPAIAASPTVQQPDIQPSPPQQLIGPDLAILGVGISMDPSGNRNVYGALVQNAGDTASGPTTLTLCALSCQSFAVEPLAPGAISKNFVIFLPLSDQPMPVLAQADSGNAISEADEGNNYFEQTVTPLPLATGT